MKLSTLLQSLSIHARACDVEIDITPSMLPTLASRDLGSRAAESIARTAGRVRLTSYSFHAAPLGVGFMRDSSHSGDSLATWNGSSWSIDGDATWRKYGPAATAIFGGNASVSAFVEDFELSDADAASIRAAIAADCDERRERVVWRPRANQFVMRVIHARGTYHHTELLSPDGSVRTCFSREPSRILSELPGGYDSLRTDPVWGRSEVCFERGDTSGTWTRVLGWRAYRRLMRAERAFLATALPSGWSHEDLRRVINAHYAPRYSTSPLPWLSDTARTICPHATDAMIDAIAPLHFDGRDRRVLEILDAIASGAHVLS